MDNTLAKQRSRIEGACAACSRALIALTGTLIGTLASPAQKRLCRQRARTSPSGGKIPYAGYTTTWMYADGEMAYCGEPLRN